MFLNLALAQTNFEVGFLAANVARIQGLHAVAAVMGADLIVFSEMAITGYPPEDLVLNKRFMELSMEAVEELARMTVHGPAIVLGGLWCEDDVRYNTVFLLDGGAIIHRQYKRHLPNYGVFDEKRIFHPGPLPEPIEWRGVKLGILICEDMWFPDVADHLKAKGAELLLCINASPYEVRKATTRESIAAARVHETGLPLVYLNQIGGQDELVFDGGSFVMESSGTISMRMHAFKEDLVTAQWAKHGDEWQPRAGAIQPRIPLYLAVVV